jgi:hypothetical protein
MAEEEEARDSRPARRRRPATRTPRPPGCLFPRTFRARSAPHPCRLSPRTRRCRRARRSLTKTRRASIRVSPSQAAPIPALRGARRRRARARPSSRPAGDGPCRSDRRPATSCRPERRCGSRPAARLRLHRASYRPAAPIHPRPRQRAAVIPAPVSSGSCCSACWRWSPDRARQRRRRYWLHGHCQRLAGRCGAGEPGE